MNAKMKSWITVIIVLFGLYIFIPKLEANKKDEIVNLELPHFKKIDNLLIKHTGFTLSYNFKTNCPDWVAWDLTNTEVSTKIVKRNDNFTGDPQVPNSNRVGERDYRGSGFDRGHMCPAADMSWSIDAMTDCFFMSNMCPQSPTLNRQWWEHLEEACRRWAKQENCIYICCGPIYDEEAIPRYIGNAVKIRVPDAFFKVILSIRPQHEKAIGFIYHNSNVRQPMGDVITTVDQIEELTGLDFFYQLEDNLENKVESMKNLKDWN